MKTIFLLIIILFLSSCTSKVCPAYGTHYNAREVQQAINHRK